MTDERSWFGREKWFRSYGLISFKPVHPKGRRVVAIMVAGFFAFGVPCLYIPFDSALGWACRAAAMAFILWGHVTALLHAGRR